MSSSFMGDLSSVYGTGLATKTAQNTTNPNKVDLDMSDFLQLMVAQLQSQTIDNTADTSDMLNQLVQMQMVTALTNMTDASVMTYAGSMVGKEVTVADYSTGKMQEKVIEVYGTGTYDGQQVLFTKDGMMYSLSDIIAIGRLPEIKEPDGVTDPDAPKDEDGDASDDVDNVDNVNGTDEAGKNGETEESTNKSEDSAGETDSGSEDFDNKVNPVETVG